MTVKPFHKASKVSLYINVYSEWGVSAKNYITDSSKNNHSEYTQVQIREYTMLIMYLSPEHIKIGWNIIQFL